MSRRGRVAPVIWVIILVIFALSVRAVQRQPTSGPKLPSQQQGQQHQSQQQQHTTPARPQGDASSTTEARLGHPDRPALIDRIVNWSTLGFELAGVAVIVVGTLVSSGVFGWRLLARRRPSDVFSGYRASIGRSILLGLELLVAADIIRTVAIRPTLMSVAVLGLIVLIRTFLSFSLEVEIEGRWPWRQKSREEKTGM